MSFRFLPLLLAIVSLAAAQGFMAGPNLSSEWEATGFNNGRRMVRDADGYYHAVYHSAQDPDAPPGSPCDIFYTHTLIPAPPTSPMDWAPPICIVDLPEDDRYPSIAIEHGSPSIPGCDDTLHVVWQHFNDSFGAYNIWYTSSPNTNTPPPDSWTIPKFIAGVYDHNSLVPDIDCSLGNILHVVYQEQNFGNSGFSEILYVRSTDHGATWGGFSIISTISDYNSQMPDVATVIDFGDNPSFYAYYSDQVHVVWNDDNAATPPHIFYNSSPDAGISWGTPTDVSLSSLSMEQDGYPSLTVSRDDFPHVVWMHGVYPHDPDTPGPYSPGLDPTLPNSFPGPIAGMYGEFNQEIRYSTTFPTGTWIPFEVVNLGISTDDNEFPSIACDNMDLLTTGWQGWHEGDYEVYSAQRPVPAGPWVAQTDVSLDPFHDDLFPSLATKKTGLYTPGYDFVWTKIDSDLSAGGHGPSAALSPAHEIWFWGNSTYNYVPIAQQETRTPVEGFFIGTNPARSGTWINTGGSAGSFAVYDISGRSVYSRTVKTGFDGFYLNTSRNLPAGSYSLIFRTEDGSTSSARLVILGD